MSGMIRKSLPFGWGDQMLNNNDNPFGRPATSDLGSMATAPMTAADAKKRKASVQGSSLNAAPLGSKTILGG